MNNVFFFVTISLLAISKSGAQPIKSARLLDLVIRDYTVHSNQSHHFRTGRVYSVDLPANLSSIKVDLARFRCGSLHRYGANVKEFKLSPGLHIHPCVERVLLVRQNLGVNFSSIYYDNYELYGYKLYTPVLGLFGYNAGSNNKSPLELKLSSGATPFTIDFINVTKLVNDTKGLIPLCASFEADGKVTLSNLVSAHLCVATRQGHYSLVIDSPSMPLRNKKVSGWKMAVGVSMGGLIGVTLLLLLLTAMFVRVKKRSRLEELHRRAYEEEALQVSMVGHVRAPSARCTTTLPTLEHEFRSNSKHY